MKWKALKLSGSPGQEARWHIIEKNRNRSCCGNFDSEGNAKTSNFNDRNVSGRVEGYSIDNIKEEIDGKFGKPCKVCFGDTSYTNSDKDAAKATPNFYQLNVQVREDQNKVVEEISEKENISKAEVARRLLDNAISQMDST